MQYRKYGKQGPEISVLGFGAMRLPLRKRNDRSRVNFSRSVEVMRKALEAGVNLIDSHHQYHYGFSEVAIGRALKGWKGHRVYIQTKAPFYRERPLDYFKKLLEEALQKTGTNSIDYLLFHSMEMNTFKKHGRKFFRLTDWAIKKGLVRFRGFSSHDTPDHVKAFVDTKEFSSMLVSFNFMNREMEDTIAYAADQGMGVSVMNPVGGGTLSARTRYILRLLPGARSSAEAALRYVLSTPGVTAALSGMNTLEQVEENTRIASRKTVMTEKQRAAMVKRLETIRRESMLFCTSCGYCMPCPHGVDIPQNFLLLNQARFFGLVEASRARYRRLRDHRDGNKSALVCRRCESCLPKCPNNVPIIDQLAMTAEMLGG